MLIILSFILLSALYMLIILSFILLSATESVVLNNVRIIHSRSQ